ncbi:hypothetical protein B7494_g3291 [Chlorociboria aeruginascens]|nr:hypothetical protein B7494_g3291 [Chlorociboria aeruginascens]
MYSSIVFFTSLLSTAFALSSATSSAPVPTATPSGPWHVFNYTSGCSPAACTYAFNITYTSDAVVPSLNEPSFSTFCAGNDIQNEFVACDDPSLVANEIPVSQQSELVVQHTYLIGQGVSEFVVEGSINVTGVLYPATQAFYIQPTETRGLA